MIGMRLDKAKSFFFDRAAVLSRVDAANVKLLSKAGAYIRRTAKGLIRKVGKKGTPSAPGSPPKSRVGLLKDRIFFIYDDASRSVLIGPDAMSMKYRHGDGKPVRGTVPEVLESGGEIGVAEYQTTTKAGEDVWLPSRSIGYNAAILKGKPTRIRVVTIAARPYMQPAYEKNADKFPKLWAGQIT